MTSIRRFSMHPGRRVCLIRLKRPIVLASALLLLTSAVLLPGCSTLPKSYYEHSVPESAEGSAVSEPETPEAKDFTLCYSSEDSLSPFAARTRSNLELASLLYQGLTALDAEWAPQPALASSVTVSGTTVTAVIRENAVFSDGSAVTAADAASSFELAKASDNYKVLLKNVAGAAAEKGAVVFTLSSPDPNAAACLSFPVIKSGTADSPVGSGPYVYKTGGEPSLEANPHADSSALPVIRLKDYPNGDATIRGLESGAISFYFDDLSSGDIPRTSSANINVPLNSLVFLGINSKKAGLSGSAVRGALSNAISRTNLAANAFAGRAQPASAPFSGQWKPAVELKGFDVNENIAVAVAQLEQAGYNNTDGNPLSVELLVSEGNSFRTTAAELLQQQLAKAGVSVTVVSLPFAEYGERLKSGDFTLYLGEIRLPANMGLWPFFSVDGPASYGIDTGGSAAAAYGEYLAGGKTLQEFADIFTQDVPFIPLCWREGLAAYDRSLTGVTPTAFNAYYGIGGWSFS